MLIVGLGNPGANYEKTRHNIGFMVIDALIKRHNATKQSSSNFDGELFKFSNHFLLKPLTFMNLSGISVAKVKKFYKVEDVVVIHDDLDLPFGTLRFKKAGGHGGHNGLKSTDEHITKEYIRVRMGIGKPEHKGEVASYVLSDFSEDEQSHLPEWIYQACESVECLLENSLEDVSSKYTIKKISAKIAPMLAFKYISYHFLKYFIIILSALVLFSVGFEYAFIAGDTFKSANLLLIFLVYKSFFSTDMLLPISLVFAMISTKVFLIRSNALVSFFSLGYSRVAILKPFFIVSFVITVMYILFHFSSSFSKANELASNIKNNSEYLSPTRDLFFSYKEKFVYFSKMLPLQSRAEDVRIFSAVDGSLKEVIIAKSAVYENDAWHIKSADLIIKPDDFDFNSAGIKVLNNQNLMLLEGFKPKILDQVYEGKVNFTINDAIEALLILKDENVNVDTIKGALYKIVIYPFFAPALVVIIFFFVPISARFLNISLFSFGAIIATLMIWGIMFMLAEFAKNKTIPSEVGIVLPVILLSLIALKQWYKYRLKV